MRKGFEEIVENAVSEISYVADFLDELRNEQSTRKLWRSWSGLLDHYIKAVSAMRRATDTGSSKSWSDRLLAEQRGDLLLVYGRQARDNANHVFEAVRNVVPRSTSIGHGIRLQGSMNVSMKDVSVWSNDGSLRYFRDETLVVRDGRHAGGSLPKEATEESQHYLVIAEVKNRSGVYPVSNPEVPAEQRAVHIAEHIYRWLSVKLKEIQNMSKQEVGNGRGKEGN